ncbi:MAG: alpha/beta hydrolase [Chloroflexi bacterium]|nr:alpha/beta hydrolase [Chloroflexota bacterium]
MPEAGVDKFATLNGMQFHYVDWGGEGRPIVLLHGLASNSRIWDMVAPILSKGHRVAALDQRGHGDTDKPDHGYEFDSMVNDLDSFIADMGFDNPIIAGHSWGADVALEYAVTHPDTPAGLCFVDGGTIELSGRPDWDLEQAKIDMAPPPFNGITFEGMLDRSKNRWGFTRSEEQSERFIRANFQILADGTVQPKFSRANHMRIIEALWDHRPSELYTHVRCPVLLMPARQKDQNSEMSRKFRREESIAKAASLLSTSKVVWMEDSIHDVPVQRPELVASVISEHIDSGFF